MKKADLIGLPFYSETWCKRQTIDDIVLDAATQKPIFITSNREMYNTHDYTFMLDENKDLLNAIKNVFPEEFI